MSNTRVEDRYVRLADMELRVQHITVRVAASTSRPTLVFLHDSLGCVETWRDFPQALAEQTGLDAIVYDRRGYGRSSPMPSEPRTTAYLEHEAEILATLLDTLGIGDVVLFGHSDGGSIALIAAGREPARVRAVITEGAHVFVEEQTLEGIRQARDKFATTDLAERLERYHGPKVPAVLSAWIDTWLSPPFRDWNIEHLLPNAKCRALIIQGDGDEFGTPHQVFAIADGWGGEAQALLIPGVDHTPHRTARDIVLDESARFIVLRHASQPHPLATDQCTISVSRTTIRK
jgi:pimeloyl-ACP methyl ester carboxylesterase